MPPIDPALIIFGLCAATYAGMLWSLLGRERLRQPAAWAVTAAVVLSLVWTGVLALHRAQAVGLTAVFDLYALSRMAVFLLVILAALLLQLTRMFQRRVYLAGSQRRTLLWWGGCAVFLLAGSVLYENPLGWQGPLFSIGEAGYSSGHIAFIVLAAGWGLFTGSAILLTQREYRRTVAPLHRNRSKYWSIVLALAAAAGGLALAQLPAPAALAQALAMAVTVVVLHTYNLPDIRLALRMAARYALTTLIAVTVYAAAFLAAQRLWREMDGGQALILALGLAALLAVIINPLLRAADGLVQRLVSGAGYDPRRTLSEYSATISSVLDLELLAAIAFGLINQAFAITRGALVTVTRETGPEPNGALPRPAPGEEEPAQPYEEQYLLRFISGMGKPLPEARLSAANPAASFLRSEHQPLAQYDIDLLPRFQRMAAGERAWFSSLEMDVFIPIYTKGAWIGLLALGPKASGDRYFDDDLTFLMTLADQTAVALENARLYEDLKQRNAENERLNTELQAANEELARLDQAKNDFINIASHELRTPLTQVMGYNDLLGELVKTGAVQPETGAQMTDAVRKAARRLEEIVDTMFDVSKIDTNTLDLQYAPVSPMTIITVAVENWQKGMTERGITVQVRGINTLPSVYGDGKRLAQVFSNLVQNAIKSTPDGGQIVISGRVIEPDAPCYSADERCLEIVISDTGIGIAPEELERIFDKFYRVGNVLLHSTGETKFKGAGPGLGLSIARGIVEAHGGRIWAESQGYNEETCPGAKFHVLLPVKPTPPPKQA